MLRIGTAGIPGACPKRDSVYAVGFVREIGLDAMELEFVRGVNMSLEKAALVREAGAEHDIVLSAHAPYYVNLASQEKPKIHASIHRVLKTAQVAAAAGARVAVFHPGYYSDREPRQVHEMMVDAVGKVRDELKSEGVDILLGPETTGRLKQYGSVEELIDLSNDVEGVVPVVDWCHLHARTQGGLTSGDMVLDTINQIKKGCRPGYFHMHFSGVEFGPGGEKKHLPLSSGHPDPEMLAKALVKSKIDATLICESPLLEKDALFFKNLVAAAVK